MALPFLSSQARKRDQVTAIDLGTHAVKAVHLQRRGDRVALLGFGVQPTAPKEASGNPGAMAGHLTKVYQALGSRCKQVVLSVGAGESLLRHAELPLVPVSDMRSMLRFNAKSYLQQDLPDHVFDCHILPPRAGAKPEPAKPSQKGRVLVGGAKNKLVEDLATAAWTAGLVPEAIVPGLIGPTNAFESAQPAVFSKDTVALVDLGFKHSSISILMSGELVLSRVVTIGGDRFTNGIAEALGISYAEAEGIKMGLAHEVQSTMVALLSPLGRELRASIDFFEHQQDRPVSQVYVSGAAARSEYILEILQTELMVPCVSWNPAAGLSVAVSAAQSTELEQVAPQLAVAVGAALSLL